MSRHSRGPVTPETFIPDGADLLRIVAATPNLSLREICGKVWPDLPWASSGTPGADSATTRVREWTATGNGTVHATAAEWLRDRLADMVAAGDLRYGHRRRDEVDALASLSYR